MTRINVDLSALRTILSAALPFAGTEDSLPVINTVLLEGKGKWLVATSTDRYIMGMTRTAVEGADGFQALVKVADAKHILKTFTAAKGQGRGPVVSLALTARTTTTLAKLTISREDGLFADCDNLTATYALVDGTFPGIAGLFHKWNLSATRTSSGFNPLLLAKFQHVTETRGEPVRVSYGDDRGLTVVQAGDYFLGAIMPVRLADESPTKDLEGWADVLGEPEKPVVEKPAAPAAKKAPAKKAAPRKKAAAKVAA
jgi:hypothetical protein